MFTACSRVAVLLRHCLFLALLFALPVSAQPDRHASRDSLFNDVLRRLDALEGNGEVDLSPDRAPSADGQDHVLARPWYDNVDLWGFGAAGFLDSGRDGTRPDGGFLVKEATVFLEAEVWDNTSLFLEIQTNRLGKDDSLMVRTGEVNAHFRDVLSGWSEIPLGIKVGRVDIPFGEEYLSQDASDNPLISTSAGYPYGFDEGIVLYGELCGVGWVTSVLDGTDARSIEDNRDKSITAKLYGNACDWLYLSGSFMRNGRAAKSAFEFGGSHFEPVGASHASSAGSSTGTKVDALLYEIDAQLTCEHGHLALSFGQAFVDDDGSTFDRDIRYFSIEPMVRITKEIYAVARYSEIGTYDSTEGYHFDGKTTAGGNSAFGYDTRRFQRLSVGLGWQPNPRVTVKAEVGKDWFDVIRQSTTRAGDDDRVLVGFEVVLEF